MNAIQSEPALENTASEPQEATAGQLLQQPLAWPLAKRLDKRRLKTGKRFKLFDYLYQKDQFFVMNAHDFQPDRLSAWVVKRNNFEQTYARPIREMRDSELNDKTGEAIKADVMPQFNLRNIGRYEMFVDVEGGLPWQHTHGLGGQLGDELDQVRNYRHEPPPPLQIWSVDYTTRLREQLRRLLIEDPWEMKYGPEATSVHDGLGRKYIVEGTHPDDLPGADFAPTLIARPEVWQEPPKGEKREERPFDIAVDAARLDDKVGGKFEL